MTDRIRLVRVGVPRMGSHRNYDQHRVGYQKEYREAKKAKLDAIKAERGCERCGESDPICLDFHHIDQTNKKYTVARLYAGTWKWERLLAEIELCRVLCANCHRKEHRNYRVP